MKTLYLLRHAKSSWDNPSLDDFDRPLADRGKKAAKAMGRYLAKEGLIPDRILCSAAQRTRLTVDVVLDQFYEYPEVVIDPKLYLATSARILSIVRETEDSVNSVMVVAHNPGMEDLALELVDDDDAAADSDPHGLQQLREKYPTAALAVIEFPDDSWAEVGAGGCRLARYVKPRDLVGEKKKG